MSTGGENESRKTVWSASREFLRDRREECPGLVLDLVVHARQFAPYTK
ncbi:MAG: hypothetical protein ACREDD_11940 [Methylocella sp.]